MGSEVPPHSHLILPPTPQSAPTARQWARRTASSWGLDGLAADAELVVSELVTNAVLHARTELLVALVALDAGLRIEVTDGSPTPVRPHRLAPPAESAPSPLDADADADQDVIEELLSTGGTTGRGLQVVAGLASQWGCSILGDGTGKVVWAELARAGPAPAGPGPRDGAADPPPDGTDPLAGPAPAVDGAGTGTTPPVCLVAVPVRLALESELNLQAMFREVQMMGLTGAPPHRAADLLATITANRDRYRGLHDSVQANLRAALGRGDRLADFVVEAPVPALSALRLTNAALDQLSAFAHQGQLLAMAPSAELAAFRRWWVDEIDRQMGGQPPQVCPFPVSAPEAGPRSSRRDRR